MTVIDPKIRTYTQNKQLIEKNRNLILKRSFKVFIENGYSATRMKDIAKATKISEGTIYRYIGTKDDLLHLVALNMSDTCSKQELLVKSLLNYKEKISYTDILMAAIKLQFSSSDLLRVYNLFINREIVYFKNADRHMLLQSQIDIVDFFDRLIKQGVQAGEFKTKFTTAIAHNILMLAHDWGLRYWYLSRKFTLKEYIEIQTELILKQVEAKPSNDKSAQEYAEIQIQYALSSIKENPLFDKSLIR